MKKIIVFHTSDLQLFDRVITCSHKSSSGIFTLTMEQVFDAKVELRFVPAGPKNIKQAIDCPVFKYLFSCKLYNVCLCSIRFCRIQLGF
jgi:hypothetical protein